MRIHIIGCSGSGKSFLADRLSKMNNIPHYDLDNIVWDNSPGYNHKVEEKIRDQKFQNLVLQKDWIIEGIYYSWVETSFEQADKIILLDISPQIYKRRIIKRFIKRKLHLQKGKKETLKSIKALLKWTDHFQKVNLIEIKEILKPYHDKVIVIHKTKEIDKLILKK